MDRLFREFRHHEAVFRICCDRFEVATGEIARQRERLDEYIRAFPGFRTAMAPVRIATAAPGVVRRMDSAARAVGVGPMASVAGVMAQLAGEAATKAGAAEAVIENGGDIYLAIASPVVVGLYAGASAVAGKLAFRIDPENTPIAVCSSSGVMGHSYSEGRCDLATVVSPDAALADAAATLAANLVTDPDDIDRALKEVIKIAGVSGVLINKGGRVGLAGRLPELVAAGDTGCRLPGC